MSSGGDFAQAAERQLGIEQAHLDTVYARLDEIREEVAVRCPAPSATQLPELQESDRT